MNHAYGTPFHTESVRFATSVSGPHFFCVSGLAALLDTDYSPSDVGEDSPIQRLRMCILSTDVMAGIFVFAEKIVAEINGKFASVRFLRFTGINGRIGTDRKLSLAAVLGLLCYLGAFCILLLRHGFSPHAGDGCSGLYCCVSSVHF